MTPTERAAVLQAGTLLEEIGGLVDPRALQLVERRRTSMQRRGWLIRRTLLVSDLVGLTFAFTLAQLFFGTQVADAVSVQQEYLFFAASLPLWVTMAKIYGLYDNDATRTDHSTIDDVPGVFHLITVGAFLLLLIAYLTGFADPDLHKLAGFWALALVLVTSARVTARASVRRQVGFLQNTVVVGAGEIGQLVASKLVNHPEYGINLVGFVDSEPLPLRPELSHVALLGSPERLPGIVRLLDIERVVIAFSNESHGHQLDLIRSLKDLDVQVDIVPRLFEMVGPGVGVHNVEGFPLVGLPSFRLSRSSRLIKREFDLLCSALGLLVLAPVLATIAVLVKLSSPGPVLFRQTRMGEHSEPFTIFKFRTMASDAEQRKAELEELNMHRNGDPRMFKVPDDPRVTRVGRFLRKYKLDELPQLWNVLRGEMSLVGPRPLILDEDRWVREWARQRLDLKPGITGSWQVLGANEIPFEEMVRLDYHYVTSWSLGRDLSLLVRTLPTVLKGTRANY